MKTKNLLMIAIGLFGLTVTSCQKEPVANISSDKAAVETGESVKFSNTTIDGVSYKWDFGDGTSSTESSPSKNYSIAGNYNVKMTAFSKKEKKSDEATIAIKVNNVNEKFVGSYNVSETTTTDYCGNFSDSYSMTITASGTNEIVINNFANGFNDIRATVSGSSISIISKYGVYSQSIGSTWDINSGSGSLNGNTLTMTYNMDDILYNYDCGEVNGSTSCTK